MHRRITTIALVALIGFAVAGCTLVQDHFTAGLSRSWTEVDPVGDGTVSVSGGALRLSIPSGTDHNNWPDRAPVNRSLRVVRAAPAKDWVIQAKVMNTDINSGRFSGFLVQSDANHFFRSDWDGDGTHVRLYVGVWNGGPAFVKQYDRDAGDQAVQWQQIAKVGTRYTVSTSLNGSSWTQRVQFTWTPAPKLIGLNVGSSGTNPGYTVRFDSFTTIAH